MNTFGYERTNPHEALLYAILLQAVKDAKSGTPKQKMSARQFFASRWYQHILSNLGIPDHWQPELRRNH